MQLLAASGEGAGPGTAGFSLPCPVAEASASFGTGPQPLGLRPVVTWEQQPPSLDLRPHLPPQVLPAQLSSASCHPTHWAEWPLSEGLWCEQVLGDPPRARLSEPVSSTKLLIGVWGVDTCPSLYAPHGEKH